MSKNQLRGMLGGGIALLAGGIAIIATTDNVGGIVLIIAGCFLLSVTLIASREKK